MIHITAVMAGVIGEKDYAAILQKRFEQGRYDFNRAYIDPAMGMTRAISIKNGSISYKGMEERNGVMTAKFISGAGRYRMSLNNGKWSASLRK